MLTRGFREQQDLRILKRPSDPVRSAKHVTQTIKERDQVAMVLMFGM